MNLKFNGTKNNLFISYIATQNINNINEWFVTAAKYAR